MEASKEAHQAAARENEVQNAQLREENEGLRGQAEQVEVLMARCARLEVSLHTEHLGRGQSTFLARLLKDFFSGFAESAADESETNCLGR